MSKLALGAQAVDIAYLPLRQDFLAKNALMTAQRDFRFGNNLLTSDSFYWSDHLCVSVILSSGLPNWQLFLSQVEIPNLGKMYA
jgi:hypothetical protein